MSPKKKKQRVAIAPALRFEPYYVDGVGDITSVLHDRDDVVLTPPDAKKTTIYKIIEKKKVKRIVLEPPEDFEESDPEEEEEEPIPEKRKPGRPSKASSAKKAANKAQLKAKAEKAQKSAAKALRQEKAEQEVLDATALCAAELNLPLSTFENPSFQNLMDAVAAAGKEGAKYKFEKQGVNERVFLLADEARQSIMKMLSGQIVQCTTEHWTSRKNETYAAFTIQWIHNFQIHRSVLAVYVFQGYTTGVQIKEDLVAKMRQWGIQAGIDAKFVVSDTAANMNLFAINVLEDHGMYHLFCMDHLIQQVAKIAFDAVVHCDIAEQDNDEEDDNNEEDESNDDVSLLKEMRTLIGYFNQSSQATEKLMEIQKEIFKVEEPLVLLQDDVTRWWSTLNSLDRLFKLKDALAIYQSRFTFKTASVPNNGNIKKRQARMFTEEEWEILDQLRELLGPFRVAQQMLGSDKSVTSSLVVPLIHYIYNNLEKILQEQAGDFVPTIFETAMAMQEKMETIFGDGQTFYSKSIPQGNRNRQVGIHRALCFANALDPRFKALSVFRSDEEKKELWAGLLEKMIEEASGQQEKPDPDKDKLGDSKDDKGREEQSEAREYNSFFAEMDGLYRQNLGPDEEVCSEEQIRMNCTVELSNYKSAIGLRMEDDPLHWWKKNHILYPTLWQLARNYLSIPSTSATSGRAFNMTGNRATAQRCRQNPDMVEDMHLLHENSWVLRKESPV